MGSFSWTKADRETLVANIIHKAPYKFLVPIGFGESFKDKYYDYGKLLKSTEYPFGKYDAYELLAFWNKDMLYKEGKVLDYLKFDDNTDMNMPVYSKYTNENRNIGIDIGCYRKEIDLLQYPLKFVSASYDGTYETCEGKSYGDPNQGFSPLSWAEYDRKYVLIE